MECHNGQNMAACSATKNNYYYYYYYYYCYGDCDRDYDYMTITITITITIINNILSEELNKTNPIKIG